MLQVLFPLAPGIESIYEPAMEEMEEALERGRENMEHMQVRLHLLQKTTAPKETHDYSQSLWRHLLPFAHQSIINTT